ncbi:ras guanyl-releasing protein 3-like [Dermacentor andersoni]|uniref:ras guanyl-releasing protein 3-like n=1 Tax=Dermacentor andersoni TaxID=34620 RepID=UPI0021556AF5|nr:ras guanyl-releasing protein 3-like [Dermacentor andersoni]XP_054934243.1 ras guanyl-releasing protein 3-like [Dermacentor andersoni]XP_054934244.1 ras guanyl-releasing protein 3-like [Dermacentor andersoni]
MGPQGGSMGSSGGSPARDGLIWDTENPAVPGFSLRAASLDAALRFLIDCFLPIGGLEDDDNRFPYIFLLMHQWFIKSEKLARCLVDQYMTSNTQHRCVLPCVHTLQHSTHCPIYKHKAQVCQVFRYWMLKFPQHLEAEGVVARLAALQSRLRQEGHSVLADLVDLTRRPSPRSEWARAVSVRLPLAKHTRKVSLVFDHLEPRELADHLTYLEHKVMKRITFLDFKQYAEQGTLADNPRLERSISQFNGLSQWTQCMVLSRSTPQQRADVVTKFVDVAKNLLELQNFSSLMAVVGGLNHSALARLSQTTTCLSGETRRTLAQFAALLSSAGNFCNYRKALAEARDFRIPILGVHMKDLISVHVALPDVVDGMINLRKMAQLSHIFQELWELQHSPPPLDVSMDLINTLKLSLDTAYTEDEIFELSLAREPKAPMVSPSKPLAMEFASRVPEGTDLALVEKQICDMVEEVFHEYDTDRDGYLSPEDVAAVTGRFPALRGLVPEECQRRLLGRHDIRRFLLRSNWAMFRHDFHETTYFRPTFCIHCTGLLWGLIKQGFKCKKCGINAHKHCREQVLAECRPLTPQGPVRSSSFSSTEWSVPRPSRHQHQQHQQQPQQPRRFKQSRSESESAPLVHRTSDTRWKSEDGRSTATHSYGQTVRNT